MQSFKLFFVVAALLLTAPVAHAAPFAYALFGNYLTVLDTASNNAVIASVPLGADFYGYRLAVNPAGTRVYVADAYRGNVLVIDTASNTVTATVAVKANSVNLASVAVNSDGTRVYVADTASGTVSVIDTASNTVTATVKVGTGPDGTPSARGTVALAVNPAGTRVYVANQNTNTVSVIDTASNTVIDSVAVGVEPRSMVVNPAGTRVYVGNFNGVIDSTNNANTVSVIDTACNTVTATVAVGRHPGAMAVNPAGTRVYVANYGSNTLSVLDAASNTVSATVATKGYGSPLSVAVSSDGTQVHVAEDNGLVWVMDAASNTFPALPSMAQGTYIALAGAPPPPPVAKPNMRVTGIEVTQGIQDLANSVPLVAGRRTFVRVYAQSVGAAVPGVTAILSGVGTFCGPRTCQSGALRTPLVPVNTVGTRITVRPNPKRSNLDDSFLFELPWQWTTQFKSLRLHAVVSTDPGLVPAQSCPNDVLNAPLHEFKLATTLKIQFVRLSYRLPGNNMTNPLVAASSAEQQQAESFIRRTYPLSNLLAAPDYQLFDGLLGLYVSRLAPECKFRKPEELSLCAHGYITRRLAALQASSGPFLGLLPGPPGSGFIGSADAAYGLIPQVPNDPKNLFFTRGACCNNRIGAGPSAIADYAAHEIGHFLGRQHPVEGAAECGHSATDPDYPYFLSFIGPGILGPVASLHPDTDLAGFDRGDTSFSIPMSHHYGQNAFDYMGYCGPPKWISDYTYNHLYSCLLRGLPGITPGCGPSGGAGPVVLPPGDWLTVFGNIVPGAARADFTTQRADRIFSSPPRMPGTYSIRMIGAGGVTLADYPFTPEAVADTEGVGAALSFGQVVPFVAGTQSIQIVDTSANRVIGGKTVPPHRPAISNVVLQGLSDPATGMVTIGWTASDADGVPLTFDIFFTRDKGVSLQPLMLGVSDTSAQINTADLAGGPAQFRVVATDGVNSASADTPLFTLANKLPNPRILTPGDGATIHVGQLVNLEGEATDAQDGVIPETGLAWSTAGRSLGSGPKLSITDLPAGINQITLTATNSLGLSNTATANVTVKENVDRPGPTLTAGPRQIGWHVGVGESNLQTAMLDIGNSGSGSLQFTTHSSAPWLTLGDATGTAPATITLTANPTGFGGGSTQEATVTLTAVGNPSQVIEVPVKLSVGNTMNIISVPGDLNGDGAAGCDDLAIVKASFGKRAGQAGFDPRADVNGDGVVNILDLSFVAKQIPAGTACH